MNNLAHPLKDAKNGKQVIKRQQFTWLNDELPWLATGGEIKIRGSTLSNWRMDYQKDFEEAVETFKEFMANKFEVSYYLEPRGSEHHVGKWDQAQITKEIVTLLLKKK